MAHRRKRDWPLLAYKFWVRVEARSWHDLPAHVRREAQDLRTLWNTLVELFDQQRSEAEAILALVPLIAEAKALVEERRVLALTARATLQAERKWLRSRTDLRLVPLQERAEAAQHQLADAKKRLSAIRHSEKDRVAPQRRALLAQFFVQARALAAQTPVHPGNAEFLLDRFQDSVRKFLAGKGQPPTRKTGPITELHFHHRYTGGGLPVQRIFGSAARRFALACAIPAEAYASDTTDGRMKELAGIDGHFQVGSEVFPFHTIISRPLPDAGTLLKSAALVGRQVGVRGLSRNGHHYAARWVWSLVLSLEVPPEAMPSPPPAAPHGTCAMNLNYRLWNEGQQLRIGVLVDEAGHSESLFLPARVLSLFRRTRDLQEEADVRLEQTKKILSTWDWHDCPPEVKDVLTNLKMVRKTGLWKLLQLEEQGHIDGTVLQNWARYSSSRWDRVRNLQRRLIRHREYHYYHLAHSLCARYTTIILGQVSWKQIAEQQDKDPRLAAAAKYRQLAGLYRFEQILVHIASKYRTQIMWKDPARITIEHVTCGAEAQQTGEVWLECARGHRYDQDMNAAQQLLTR